MAAIIQQYDPNWAAFEKSYKSAHPLVESDSAKADEANLDKLLKNIYDPSSSSYHQYVTDFGSQFKEAEKWRQQQMDYNKSIAEAFQKQYGHSPFTGYTVSGPNILSGASPNQPPVVAPQEAPGMSSMPTGPWTGGASPGQYHTGSVADPKPTLEAHIPEWRGAGLNRGSFVLDQNGNPLNQYQVTRDYGPGAWEKAVANGGRLDTSGTTTPVTTPPGTKLEVLRNPGTGTPTPPFRAWNEGDVWDMSRVPADVLASMGQHPITPTTVAPSMPASGSPVIPPLAINPGTTAPVTPPATSRFATNPLVKSPYLSVSDNPLYAWRKALGISTPGSSGSLQKFNPLNQTQQKWGGFSPAAFIKR